MKALNQAIGDAAIFKQMLVELTRTPRHHPRNAIPHDVQVWNDKVEAKRAEQHARKLALKVKP